MDGKNRPGITKTKDTEMIIAITGSRGKGKSFILEKIAKSLRSKTTSLGGVISRSIVRGENHHGYELLCVGSGRLLPQIGRAHV